MPRSFLSYLFIFSLLFVGIESAGDYVGGEQSHGVGNSHLLVSDDIASQDTQSDDTHCQHCCHGHCSSISGQLTVVHSDVTNQSFSLYEPNILNFAQAPPTPPPSA